MKADVIVVGGGNAALTAALAAANAGVRVVALEAAAANEAGGNSWFTDGAMRVAFEDEEALFSLLQLSTEEAARIVVPPYPTTQYINDLQQAGGDNESLQRRLAEESYATMRWLRDNGVPLELIYDNQSHDSGGKRIFFGNLVVRANRRGIGLVGALREQCVKKGVKIFHQTRAQKLLMKNGACAGVVAETNDGERLFNANAVVLACGGFEANQQWRKEYLGEEWELATVRGTRHNRGDGIRMALAVGAAPAGNWKGCHAVGTDANAPSFGDASLPGDIWKKHSYPYGLLVNKDGRRFVDEGADLRNYTYAKYGKEILRQRGGAVQIFDAKTEPLLRSEYRHARVAKCQAGSLRELAAMLQAEWGVDGDNLVAEITAYNQAVCDGEFSPAVLDGKRTRGLTPEKTNWALPVDTPPFLAFPVGCGITFTFGGVAVDGNARVLSKAGEVIAGLCAAGEMVGGLFGENYPGGSGLMSGSVFGKIAGESATKSCL